MTFTRLISSYQKLVQPFINPFTKNQNWFSEQLQSDHSPNLFVHLIDTSDPKLLDRKPLLNDLIKFINISPPERNYLISSSDFDLYTAGLQLIKNHPNSPILSYIPPYGTSLPDSIPEIDHLFRWEKDDTLSLVHRTEEPFLPSNRTHLDEFEPLVLLLKAHSQTPIPLKLVKDYLKPWNIKFSSTKEETVDQKMIEYIDSAVAHAVISLFTLKPMPESHQLSPIIMVQLQKPYLSSDLNLGQNLSSPTSTEKLLPDEDSLTTTSSELETKSTSGQSSPSRLQIQSTAHQFLHQEDDHIRQKVEGELIKHKYPSSALDTNPLADRSPKKKKSQTSSSMSLLSPKNQVGSSSSPKERSPVKNNQTVVVTSSKPIQQLSPSRSSSTGTPTQLEIFTKNQGHSVPGTIVEFKFRDRDLQGESLDLPIDRHPANGDLDPRPSGSILTRSHQEIRSSLWINCSSGLINNSMPFIFPLSHNTHSKSDVSLDLLQRTTIGLRTINFRYPHPELTNQEEQDQNTLVHPPTLLTHLHFKHRLIPAFLRISSSPVTPHQHDRPSSLVPLPLSSPATSSELDDVD